MTRSPSEIIRILYFYEVIHFVIEAMVRSILTQPNEKGRLFPVPSGMVAIGGGCDSLRSETTPRSHPAVPSPPATWNNK